MDLVRQLVSSQLLDCSGRVTHTLALLPDGRVEVSTPSIVAIVDPATKTVLLPRGARLPEQVLDHAATLARSTFG